MGRKFDAGFAGCGEEFGKLEGARRRDGEERVGEGRGATKRTQNPEHGTRNMEHGTRNMEPGTWNSEHQPREP